MKIPYARFLSFLVNGVDQSYNTNLLYVKEDLEFGLEEYVFSQMHLAILCHLMKRDLYLVSRVYRYFAEKRPVDIGEMSSVLRWFYRDMSGFLRNVARCGMLRGIGLRVTVPEDVLTSLGIGAEEISFACEKEKVLLALTKGDGKYERYIRLHYRDVKGIGSLFSSGEQEDRYVMSVILLYYSESDKFVRVVE